MLIIALFHQFQQDADTVPLNCYQSENLQENKLDGYPCLEERKERTGKFLYRIIIIMQITNYHFCFVVLRLCEYIIK